MRKQIVRQRANTAHGGPSSGGGVVGTPVRSFNGMKSMAGMHASGFCLT